MQVFNFNPLNFFTNYICTVTLHVLQYLQYRVTKCKFNVLCTNKDKWS